MSKQLIKLTGAGWDTETSVGHIVEAVPHTRYPARKGVYYWKGYEIFTQPYADDPYETAWAAEIFERCNPQPEPVKSAMTITQEQFDQAAKALHISLGGEDAKDYIERGGSPLDSDFTALIAALAAIDISVEEEDV